MKYLIIILTILFLNSCGTNNDTTNTTNRVKVNNTSSKVNVVKSDFKQNNLDSWNSENIDINSWENIDNQDLTLNNLTDSNTINPNDNNWKFEFSDIKTFIVETYTNIAESITKTPDVKKADETKVVDNNTKNEPENDIIKDNINKDNINKDNKIEKEKIYIEWDFADDTTTDNTKINTNINIIPEQTNITPGNTNTSTDNTNTLPENTNTSTDNTNTWTIYSGEIIDTSLWNGNAKEAWKPVIKN